MSSSSSSSSDEPSLKPQFFVCRPNGNQIPLIAMDELPTNVVVHGVPRVLTARDTVGMVSIGEHPGRHSHYSVDFAGSGDSDFEYQPDRSPKPAATANAPDKSLLRSKYADAGLTMHNGYPAPPLAFGIEEQRGGATVNQIRERTTSKDIDNKAVATEPDVPKFLRWSSRKPLLQSHTGQRHNIRGKVYCSFWLRKGECDYAQQGCMYKHEMPTSLETLRQCGHTDIPRWYQQHYGVFSLAAVPGSGAAGGRANIANQALMDSNWRSNSEAESDGVAVRPKEAPIAVKVTLQARPIKKLSRGSARTTPSLTRRLSRTGTYASHAAPMTLDQQVAFKAIAKIKLLDAEEQERKAKARDATSRLSAAHAHRSTTPLDKSRPVSRGGNEPVDSDHESNTALTPATSRGSVMDGEINNIKKTPVLSTATMRVKVAQCSSAHAKGREQAVREARNKMAQQAVVAPPTGPRGQTQRKHHNLARTRASHDQELLEAHKEAEDMDDLLDFGEVTDNTAPISWRPDGYDHDD